MIETGLQDDLRALMDLLRAPGEMLEERVGRIGSQLCTAVEVLGRLTAAFEAVRLGFDRPDVAEAMADLTRTAAHIAAMAGQIPAERRHLEQLAASLEDMSGRITRMRTTVKVIEVLVVNARIAAAYIHNQQVELSVFTGEVSELAGTTRQTVENFATGHRRLTTLVRQAHEGHTRFERENLQRLHQVAERLGTAVTAVDTRRANMATAAGDITVRSRRIGEQVGTAVMALQIGDRTRQRVDHLVEAIGFLVDPAGGEGTAAANWQAGLTPEEQGMVAASICRLQQAQLRSTVDDFDAELRRVIGALERLAVDVVDLVRSSTGLYASGDAGEDAFLQQLGTEITHAEQLMRLCGSSRAEFDAVATEAAGVLKELLGQAGAVELIETDMRLAGLNTVLICGRLGTDGQALKVIAEELNGAAGETVRQAQDVITGIRSVQGEAAAVGQVATAQNATTLAELDQRMGEALRILEGVCSELGAALGMLREDGGRLTALLQETTGGIDIHTEFRRAMEAAAEQLGRVGAVPAVLPAKAAAASERLLGVIRDRYSMASEREIHDPLSGQTAPAMAAAGGATAAAEIDDLLF
ncbi:conserved protein of unknown function [Rhodovastum atsumiense]|nr:hypothetical protein [Rhodovastum atsumiense]CAH2601895.1 conserved protein of unknown function [Rhodovastum atsumiense]